MLGRGKDVERKLTENPFEVIHNATHGDVDAQCAAYSPSCPGPLGLPSTSKKSPGRVPEAAVSQLQLSISLPPAAEGGGAGVGARASDRGESLKRSPVLSTDPIGCKSPTSKTHATSKHRVRSVIP
ncbi:unnamed protein product [Pleuronectes platessa]|uniref:Uncharacterized protein n=1 Tax=Pleuronectes platessa TaxID=8262 RepID=A0A9N7UNW4_PLEPL|nr:unnamed protein product [Pleuronectes platessa]